MTNYKDTVDRQRLVFVLVVLVGIFWDKSTEKFQDIEAGDLEL